MLKYCKVALKQYIAYETLVAIALFIIVAKAKANIINMPYYWDELGVYISPTHWLANGSLIRSLPGFHPPYMFFGHPFASYLTLAALFKTFGESIFVSHIFILLVSYFGILYTYLLGKYLQNSSVGVIAALLLFCSPLYFAQSGMVNGDVIISTLGIITIYYFIKRNYIAYLITATLLVLTKESSAAIIVAILIYLYIISEKRRMLLKVFAIYSIPLLFLLIFFVMQKLTTGMILPNSYFNEHNFYQLNITDVFSKLKLVSGWIFVEQRRYILLIIFCVNLIVNGRRAYKKEYLLFIIVIVFFVAAFTGIFFLTRYIIPILPYFYLMSASSIVMLFAYKRIYILVTIIIMVLFIVILYGHDDWGGSHENDMQYTDIVLTHKDACDYIENNYPLKKVLTSWPLTAELREPFLGYVQKSIVSTDNINEQFDILVYSKQSNSEQYKIQKLLKEKIKKKKITFINAFARNGKVVEIYIHQDNAIQSNLTLTIDGDFK
jgi:hypothetical protein